MRFDASVSLVDPVYCFALSACGLEFDLGKELILHRPTISAAAVNSFGSATLDAFGDYFDNLNASLETIANAVGSFPPVNEAGFGRPSEFAAREISIDLTAVNAWSGQIIAATQAGLSNRASRWVCRS